jgi:hypothetical protein
VTETCEPTTYDDAERQHPNRHERRAAEQREPVFYTDDELQERWHCSQMSLWRRRKAGTLPHPIRIGGVGRNLTPASVVRAMETS